MSYTSLRFDIPAAAADAFADALLEHGALSADLSDPYANTSSESPIFGEPDAEGNLPDASGAMALWKVSRVTALFPQDFELSKIPGIVEAIASELKVEKPLFETLPLPERDWVRETQAQFSAIPITDDFWIVPTWRTPPAEAKTVLRLDPGLAFGTGSHPTTQLCLKWLASSAISGCSVLDYGCGSGILLLAAALLGADAKTSIGTDIDPQAIIASNDNAELNGISLKFVLPDAMPSGTVYDVTVANILANPLLLLAPLLASRTRAGGKLILSGILSSQKDEILARYAAWFDIRCWREQGGWALLEGVRKLN